MSDTREMILERSLELFARRGCEAVSVRDICAAVGIKESSLYYHFRNKRAVTEELYSLFERRAEELMASLGESLSRGADRNALLKACAAYFDAFLCDGFCNRMLRLLGIEQLSDRRARMLYSRWLFDEPLGSLTRVFGAMTARRDASALAVGFYSPVFLYAQRWLLTGTLSEGDKAAFRADAYRHIRRFLAGLSAR